MFASEVFVVTNATNGQIINFKRAYNRPPAILLTGDTDRNTYQALTPTSTGFTLSCLLDNGSASTVGRLTVVVFPLEDV